MTKHNQLRRGMNLDEVQAYLDSRNQAAAKIDIERCEVRRFGVDEATPMALILNGHGASMEPIYSSAMTIATDGYGKGTFRLKSKLRSTCA
jgi:hypothetical protein